MGLVKFHRYFLNLVQCAKAYAILDGVNNVVLHLINSNFKNTTLICIIYIPQAIQYISSLNHNNTYFG